MLYNPLMDLEHIPYLKVRQSLSLWFTDNPSLVEQKTQQFMGMQSMAKLEQPDNSFLRDPINKKRQDFKVIHLFVKTLIDNEQDYLDIRV